MSLLSRISTLLGLILLAHAGYSAHEHSTLHSQHLRHTTTSSTTAPTLSTLPLDITLETLLALLFAFTGLVLGADRLKPISWSVWAGGIEKYGEQGGGEGFNPFAGLEDRKGFWDVRAKRNEFADWVRERGDGGVKS